MDSFGQGEELRRTGKVYVAQFDGIDDLLYLQTLSPRGNILLSIFYSNISVF